jgi:hypothetical protein
MEEPEAEPTVRDGAVEFAARPCEIVTLRLGFA